MPKAICPECGVDVEIPEDALVGEIVSCPDCGLELEVVEIAEGSVKVRVAAVEGEDWGE